MLMNILEIGNKNRLRLRLRVRLMVRLSERWEETL
jgi:hypothetical protein